MFGFSLRCQLFQGPAVRTWNCVSNFANLLWYKFYHVGKQQIMPRSRRRHHSRSRSRSRSSSLDRPRDAKRRKIDSYDSHKHSLSSEEEAASQLQNQEPINISNPSEKDTSKEKMEVEDTNKSDSVSDKSSLDSVKSSPSNDQTVSSNHEDELNTSEIVLPSISSDATASPSSSLAKFPSLSDTPKSVSKKALTPRQIQKRQEAEKRRGEREAERKALKQKRTEEKDKLRHEKKQEKEKVKTEKQEQKLKELEGKQKKKELQEEKRKKEREEKDQKRKEKQEKLEEKRREQEEKDKEKQKMEEKKQRVSAAFVNFFTKKSTDPVSSTDIVTTQNSNQTCSIFMPFEVKADMRLAPTERRVLTDDEKKNLFAALETQNCETTFIQELKSGKVARKDTKSWPIEDDDVILVDNNPGESIDEQALTSNQMRAKFLSFHENRRPAYYGTWTKESSRVKSRKPFAKDQDFFNYEVDSDEDWEEEDPDGESLRGSDEDEKENEADNYEEDNEFFVPHGHLSDDEVNDEENAVMNPEVHKARLKLLRKEFDEEMKETKRKIKPRVIGCIWYSKDQNNLEKTIHEFLKPLAVITKGPIVIKKRAQMI